MEFLIEEAYRVAVLTEKTSLDFYRKAAAKASGGSGKTVLEQLVRDETEHIKEILRLYPGAGLGNLWSTIAWPDNWVSSEFDDCLQETDGQMTERNAIALALCRERSCMDQYEIFVATLREPEVRQVFERALQLSRRHYKVLEEKLRHLAGGHGSTVKSVPNVEFH
jgi:erythrin-vacuolar iron transport family protein